MNFKALTAFLTTILCLGCAPAGDVPVSKAYGDAVRDLGIFPVFPPREEFQVGDVYFWSQSSSDPSDTISVYIDTFDWVRHEASQFMLSRIVFRDTGTDPSEINTGEAADLFGNRGILARRQDLSGADRDVLSSLPIAAFPTITADAGISGGLGIVDLLAAVGLGGSGRTQLSLNLNDVRTYWVPKSRVENRVRSEAVQTIMPRRQFAFAEARRAMTNRTGGASTEPCSAGRRCGISVITRVYLARRIDYTYRNAAIVAAGIRRSELLADQAPEDATPPPAAPNVIVSVSQSGEGELDTSETQKQIDLLKQQVNALAESQSPGQSVSFSAWNALGITFSRNYQRPVAVGWDGFDLPFVPPNVQ